MSTQALDAARLFDLTGRTAIVTGASSGLGVTFAQTLAANGANGPFAFDWGFEVAEAAG
jgi:NAD(P)-dependent dehydrogenase (short-subunit alcohol dehydrogenase family)